jgi:hypothetical protein
MVKIIFLVCVALLGVPGVVYPAGPVDMVDLGQYRWKQRLLFLFSPSPKIPAYQALRKELDGSQGGVRERDLLVFHVLEQGPSVVGSREINPQAAENFRRRFGVRQGAFTVVLVGKDGGVKLQQSGPVTLAEIFGLIDSMPMRQREMQGK